MVYVTWKIERTDSSNNTTTFTDFSRPILNVNLGEGKDTFSFDVQNGNATWDNYWQRRDKVTIYRTVNNDLATTADILMVGTVTDTPGDDTASKNTFKVKGNNYSEAVMGAVTFIDAENLDVAEAIQEALESTARFNPAFEVGWHPNNPSVKRDAVTAFPTVKKKYFYKTLKQILEELSTNDYTGDGRYYWYVDKDNKLVWQPDTAFDTGTFDASTDGYRSKKKGSDTSKVKNFIVGRGGSTPAGQPIVDYYPDYASIAKHGMKYFYFTEDQNLAQTLVRNDISLDGGDEQDQYPPSLATGFTTKWQFEGATVTLAKGTVATNGSFITINTGGEANNKADYNQALKLHVRAVMKKHMRELVSMTANGQLKIDLELQPGQKSWGLGDVISVTLAEEGLVNKPLRVDEIQYTTNSDRFSLVEDEGTL